MGKNSRSRRNAKRRKQEARRRNKGASDTGSDRASTPPEEPAPCSCSSCQRGESADSIEIETLLIRHVGWLWEHGWQPAEVVRQARRLADRVAADLVTIAILVDDVQRESQQRDPLWVTQIESLQRTSCVDDLSGGWLERWCGAAAVPYSMNSVSVDLLEVLAKLGPIHRLIPPPGSDRVDAVQLRTDGEEADPVLARVRALLNKAESTEYPAEAEAFTAKAQALISRHALEDLLSDAHSLDPRPASIRISIDEPYVNAKAALLHAVAVASRCRSVQLTRYAMCSVVGRPGDLRRVEILFTSLLVQAQAALNEIGRTDSPGSLCRSRSFRSSFLSGYASRIEQRLLAERDRVVEDFGSDALPVIARVDSAVDDEVERLFGDGLSSVRSRTYNAQGWGTGVDVANKAWIRDAGLGSAARRSPSALASRAREGG